MLLGLLLSFPALATTLTAYTEQWPPYNYAEGDKVKGISTDILRAACEVAKLSCSFQIVPWARAHKIASKTPNTVLYTTARKPSREKEFLWVGPILPRTTWVYGKAGHPKDILSFADLANCRVGVVREEAAQQDLEAVGVPTDAFTVQSSNADVLRMLLSGSVDAMVDTELGMAWNLRQAAKEPTVVKKLMKLSDDGAYYFALNLKSDAAAVTALQAAIDKLKHEGKLDALVRQYIAQIK
jgi:polar amino acid transport system substrate-binding protein